MKTLWALFIIGQVFSAGNMNYQQETGHYEINPLYGRHPSKERIYLTKVIQVGGVYAATKIFPKHKKKILGAVTTIVYSFIIYDKSIGIGMKVRF